MLKFQIVMIAILISCIAFTACERMQTDLNMVMPDPDQEMTDDYKSWMSVSLPEPPTEVTHPSESGSAHGVGDSHCLFQRHRCNGEHGRNNLS